ncbi:hypothetical protein FRB90_009057 [Tulasnella sp. 427]|nr:hypothetical protein FRB90_009057 [Tulasnella sp. 427]
MPPARNTREGASTPTPMQSHPDKPHATFIPETSASSRMLRQALALQVERPPEGCSTTITTACSCAAVIVIVPTTTLPTPPRQLFDPSHDDPIRFGVLTRAAPAKPPAGGEEQRFGRESVLREEMKRIYREIAGLEAALLKENGVVEEDVESRILSRFNAQELPKRNSLLSNTSNWRNFPTNFSFALKPQVPASPPCQVQHPRLPMEPRFPTSRHVPPPNARTTLSFIFYAYGLYTPLLEDENFAQSRILRLEALDDLSRYQIAVIAQSSSMPSVLNMGTHLALPTALTQPMISNGPDVSRMNDSPLPLVGVHAAAKFELEDDCEIGGRTGESGEPRVWDAPGQGWLHHHLGLVSADAKGKELREVYHFAKSLVSYHQCDAVHESIPPLFSVANQPSRYSPSLPAPSIFLPQSMLFTRIQLDDLTRLSLTSWGACNSTRKNSRSSNGP